MLKQFGSLLNIPRVLFDSFFHILAFFSAVYYAGIRADFISLNLAKEILLMLLIYGLSYKYFGLYAIQRVHSLFIVDLNIFKASCMAILIYNILCLFLPVPINGKEILFFFCLDLLYLTSFRMLLLLVLHQMRRKGHNLRYILIVGAGPLGQNLHSKIEGLGWTGLKVIGYLDDNIPQGTQVKNTPVLGTTDAVKSTIQKYPVDQLFICLPMRAFKKIEEIMNAVGEELTMIRIVPDLYQYPLFLKSSIGILDDIPIITLNDTLFHGWRRLAKRAIDIAMSSFVLLILLPLFLFLAIIIKITSAGPVFFKQERVGFNGKKFSMYKFRSMRSSKLPEVSLLTPQNDPRVTIIGKVLRKTSIDELPQFFNVLLGDMSIVGPRPERTWVVNTVKSQIPGYMLKHKMKAGITGWAQVNGWRGDTSLERRIEHDLYYIENWSLLFDLKIMILTVFRGLTGKNAY